MYYPLNTKVVVSYRKSADNFDVINTTNDIFLNQTYSTNSNIPLYVDGPLQKINIQQQTIKSKISNNPLMIMDEVEHAKMSSLMNAKIQDKIGSK